MALTYDQISSITQKKFIPKLVDNIFDSNALLNRAKNKWYEKIDGGTSIMQPLGYAQTTAAGFYSGADTLDTTDNEQISAAEYNWRFAYANITIKRTDELKNSGDSAILKLVQNKTQMAEKTLKDILGTALFNAGTDSKAPGGLRLIVSNDQTVGGINQSLYSWWAGQIDSTTTTLSLKALQTKYNAASIDADHPTVIVSGRTIFDIYWNMLQPQQRFMDSKTANAGFESLLFNGVPWIIDSHCPANHLFMLNENYLSLCVHKDEDFRFEPFAKPLTQNVKVAKIYWAGNITSSNNRMHAKFSAITA